MCRVHGTDIRIWVFPGRSVAGNRPVTFVGTVEDGRWQEEAEQLQCHGHQKT
jgi:hypothetical protein